MAYPKHITDVHIELTDKCQAACPMCARNHNGGADREFVGQHDITLEQFQEWFPDEWLANLENFFACGNYGDPIIARDCLEIFEHVRHVNPTARLAIHTNGSARSIQWWERLAKVMGKYQEVIFAVDGYADTHVLYRRGTDWHKIMENAQAYIEAGGTADIDCLVFEHNQHEMEKFREDMLSRGFRKVNIKSTGRFYDMTEFPVQGKSGNFEYNLKPATNEFKPVTVLKLEEIVKDIKVWDNIRANATIVPKCVNRHELYVDARGNLFPCCYVGSDWVEQPLKGILPIQRLRNQLVEDTQTRFKQLGVPNLNGTNVQELVAGTLWDDLETQWQGNKAWACVKACGS